MKLPALPVSDHGATLNFEELQRLLSVKALGAFGAGSTTTSTSFVTGPSVVVVEAGSYAIDFGGSVQLQVAALEQGALRVHIAGVASGPPAAFVGRDQYDSASIATSFDASLKAGQTIDLRYLTQNGNSVTFANLWLRARLLPS